MAKYQDSQLNATFSALSDPTRRAILAQLSLGEACVTDLAEPFRMSLPAVSKHLRVLERAGLLRQEKQGRVRCCHLVAEPLKEASEWIERYRRFWEGQLDSLADFLKSARQQEPPQ